MLISACPPSCDWGASASLMCLLPGGSGEPIPSCSACSGGCCWEKREGAVREVICDLPDPLGI